MTVLDGARSVRRGLAALALVAVVLVPAPPAGSPVALGVPLGPSAPAADRVAATQTGRVRPAPPVWLRIPRLGVDTGITPVSTAPDGVLDPPGDPALVGWWSGGARPGAATGAALLTGHTVHEGGGVFDDLAVLDHGDLLVVSTVRGDLAFGVETVRYYDHDDLAGVAQDLFGAVGPSRLVLVTCAGWDAGTYLGNTVVVARPR